MLRLRRAERFSATLGSALLPLVGFIMLVATGCSKKEHKLRLPGSVAIAYEYQPQIAGLGAGIVGVRGGLC